MDKLSEVKEHAHYIRDKIQDRMATLKLKEMSISEIIENLSTANHRGDNGLLIIKDKNKIRLSQKVIERIFEFYEVDYEATDAIVIAISNMENSVFKTYLEKNIFGWWLSNSF
jgi:hypothetical protein